MLTLNKLIIITNFLTYNILYYNIFIYPTVYNYTKHFYLIINIGNLKDED